MSGNGNCETIRRPITVEPVRIERIEIRLLRMPLVEPFETSFGKTDTRIVFLVALDAGGLRGWGEVAASRRPLYSYETVGTARHIISSFLAPLVLSSPLTGLDDLASRLSTFKGHNMAKAGIELAFMHLVSLIKGSSISALIGGTRSRIAVGVSLGIQHEIDALLERVRRHLDLGYQRIKLKIKPGRDIDVVEEVRRRHPDILLSVDANSAYRLSDLDHLKKLDEFGLLMIEQPLDHDDLVDHGEIQSKFETSICLDESITGPKRARDALHLGSCRIINIKVGRVGGYSSALQIHDLCLSRQTPVWCGGMLESGIGRAHNIALASLPGFVLPGDTSASSRYFAPDIIKPGVMVASDGTINVPDKPGLGFEVDLDYIDACTEEIEHLTAP